jgi:hypothetical protein
MFVYLFESVSIWSKDYKRSIWIVADNNLEAQKIAQSYNFDWAVMSRYLNKQ